MSFFKLSEILKSESKAIMHALINLPAHPLEIPSCYSFLAKQTSRWNSKISHILSFHLSTSHTEIWADNS